MALTLRGERNSGRKRVATNDELTYERVFVVETDNDSIGQRAVSFCPGLPFLGYIYQTETEADPLARCIRREANIIDDKNRRLWEVTVEYSSKHDDPEQENNEEEAIELEPPAVSLDFAMRVRAVTGQATLRDQYGAAVVNQWGGVTTSAGEPFDPPAEEEVEAPILTISRNEIGANWFTWRDYCNSVNNDNFLGANPRQVKMGVRAEKKYGKGFRYYRVTYVMEFEEMTWDLQLLDIGTWYLEPGPDGTQLRKYFLTDDEPPQPRLGLLLNGGALMDGDQPQFRRFSRRKERPFNALQLEGALNA